MDYPFKRQPQKMMKLTQTTADELLECVWPFGGVEVKDLIFSSCKSCNLSKNEAEPWT